MAMRLRADRREERRREALQRNEAWGKMAPAEKLRALDRRLGTGIGARRQRTKLRGE